MTCMLWFAIAATWAWFGFVTWSQQRESNKLHDYVMWQRDMNRKALEELEELRDKVEGK